MRKCEMGRGAALTSVRSRRSVCDGGVASRTVDVYFRSGPINFRFGGRSGGGRCVSGADSTRFSGCGRCSGIASSLPWQPHADRPVGRKRTKRCNCKKWRTSEVRAKNADVLWFILIFLHQFIGRCAFVKLHQRDERTNGRTDGRTETRLFVRCVCQGRSSFSRGTKRDAS